MLRAEGLEREFNMEPMGDGKVVEGEVVSIETIGGGENLPAILEPKATTEINHRVDSSDFLKTELRNLVTVTKDALDTALLIQQEDPTSRNTEAVSKMADSVAKVLTTLAGLEQAEKGFEFKTADINSKNQPVQITNNNLVIATSDLIAQIVANSKKQQGELLNETK